MHNFKENAEVSIGMEKYRSKIIIRNHELIADEPFESGGQNLGPNPYDFLLAALGSCTAMTLRMYADRKEWNLTGVNVKLGHEKIHAEDCKDCESTEGKIDTISRVIYLEGELTDEQRNRLLEIANKCPVHKTLHSEIKVRSSLGE
jgi:putative redox protein